jgi:hypothetical protein
MLTEEIIVLANSLKMRGRCVAGISTRTGAWVRPVSDFEHGELYPLHFQMGGGQPKPLDVVRFSYSEPVPEPAQPENLQVEEKPWELTDRLEPESAYDELKRYLSAGPELLGNQDRGVPEDEADAGVEASLALIEPNPEVHFVVREGFVPGKRETRVNFHLRSQFYNLPVTDPLLKKAMLAQEDGICDTGEIGMDGERILLTVSLGIPFNGTNWKLAAACLPLP